jgi:hypothetical protein
MDHIWGCPKSKCTDFHMDDLGMQHLVDVYRWVGNDLGCMYILVQTRSVESIMSYCCLCTVMFYNLCNICDAAMVMFTKNFYLQARELITPSTKMSSNDFENRPVSPKGHCRWLGAAPQMHQLTQRFQLQNFWWKRKNSHPSTASLQPTSSSVWSFWDCGKYTKNCDRWAKNTHRKWFLVMLWSMERMLEPLRNFPRVLYWRR